MKTWIIKVCDPGRDPFWLGPFEAESRAQAKADAPAFMAMYLPSTCKIVNIAQGRIEVTLEGPEYPFP